MDEQHKRRKRLEKLLGIARGFILENVKCHCVTGNEAGHRAQCHRCDLVEGIDDELLEEDLCSKKVRK